MTNQKQPKIVVCPPGPENVHFQTQAFDEKLKGTDPIKFVEWGKKAKKKLAKGDREAAVKATKVREERFRQAEAALAGHPKAKEIMKVLRGK